MQTNNTSVINNAVDLVNQASVSAVEHQISAIIADTTRIDREIASKQRCVSELQKSVLALNGDEITIKSALGVDALPNTQTGSTIAKVIEDMNKAKQDRVRSESSRMTQAIANEQNNIAALLVERAKLVEKMTSLKPELVTVESVLGQ